MGKQRRSNCIDCGASGNDGPISKAGLCTRCGEERLLSNINAMRAREGYQYDRWRTGMARHIAALGALPVDVGAALDGEGTVSRSAAPPSP
jgi:hypothetical protein